MFEDDSSARRASDRREHHGAVSCTKALTVNFLGVRVRQFVKSDEISLQTVKQAFSTNAQLDQATTDMFF